MFKKLLRLVLAVCLMALSFNASAQYKWQGPTDGLWSTAANWLDVSTGATATVAPIGTTNIVFDMPADISINANGSVCNSILVTNNATVTIKALGGSSGAPWGLTLNSQTSSGVKALQIDAGAKLDIRSTNTVAGGHFGLKPLSTTTLLINGTLAFSGTGLLGNARFNWDNNAIGSPILVTVNGTYLQDLNSGTTNSPLAPSTITFGANSTFESKRAGGFSVPLGIWDPTSNIKVSGINGAPSTSFNSGVLFGNFDYNCPAQTGTANFSIPTNTIFKGNVKITTGLSANAAAKIRLASTLNNMTVEGNLEVSNAALFISNSATVAASGISLNVFGNVILSLGATLTLQETTTGAATITKIKGNITIPAGCTLNTLSTSTTTLQTIELNGATNQTITAAGTVSNAQLFTLKMNNPAGVTLATDLSVPQLDLSSAPGGVINTGTNILTISTPNTALNTLKGGSATCHVVGKVKRNTATTGAYILPIGTGDSFRKVTIYPTTATATSYQAQLVLGTPSAGTLPAGIARVSPSESWDISQPGGTVPALIGLSSDNGITVPAELSVLHYLSATSTWEDLGNDMSASTVGTLSTVTSLNPATSFSPFAMGATAAPNNPLPVKLIRFDAVAAKNAVDLTWETAFERNASSFEVQHSADGKTFKTVANVQAKGNSDSNQKYTFAHKNVVNGTNFYRLHIVDNDVKAEYSKVVSVNMSSKSTVKVYPTAASDMITVELTDDAETAYQIVNNTGAIVMEGTIVTQQNISVANLSQGIYFIKMANHEAVSFAKQ